MLYPAVAFEDGEAEGGFAGEVTTTFDLMAAWNAARSRPASVVCARIPLPGGEPVPVHLSG